MAEAQRTSQQKIIELKRGLFVLRYASTENDSFPPKVTVAPEARSIDNVQFVLHPDREEAVMWHPGTALVVQAAGPAKLQVEVKATGANGFSSATVRVEELTQGNRRRKSNSRRTGMFGTNPAPAQPLAQNRKDYVSSGMLPGSTTFP